MADRQPALNVLQVASSLYAWGGVERYVAYLADGLADQGHRITVACPPRSPLAGRTKGSIELAMRGKMDLRGFAAYLRLFRQTRFDVVHGHFSPDFLLPAYAARITRQPLTVMTRHVAIRWARPKARMYARLWRRIVPVSRAVERRLLESGISPSQMRLAKAGTPIPKVAATRRETRARLGVGDTDFAVGSFGRLVREKGVDVLVNAIGHVPGGRACIFGEGPEETPLKAQAPAAVSFHGRIADVGNAMAAMDVVAIPSVWEESFPYAALEAMALGRPLAVSRIGGLPEMVEEGVNGLLFTAGDASDLKRVLCELAADPARLRSMGNAGRDRYDAEFTVDHMVNRMLAVYRSAAPEPPECPEDPERTGSFRRP